MFLKVHIVDACGQVQAGVNQVETHITIYRFMHTMDLQFTFYR